MVDVAPLWDFEDAAGSVARFRAAADASAGEDRDILLTQLARGLGLLEQYADAHGVLDSIDVPQAGEVAVRASLERGRLLNSSGDPIGALDLFQHAADLAATTGLEALRVDALHMTAIAAPPEDRLRLNEEALVVARSSADRSARDWDASLLNNIGMCHVDEGRLDEALGAFEAALAARRRIGDDARTRVARWMVAWVKRLQGRVEEALADQLDLRDELGALGLDDPFVDEEIALLGGT